MPVVVEATVAEGRAAAWKLVGLQQQQQQQLLLLLLLLLVVATELTLL